MSPPPTPSVGAVRNIPSLRSHGVKIMSVTTAAPHGRRPGDRSRAISDPGAGRRRPPQRVESLAVIGTLAYGQRGTTYGHAPVPSGELQLPNLDGGKPTYDRAQ